MKKEQMKEIASKYMKGTPPKSMSGVNDKMKSAKKKFMMKIRSMKKK